MHELDRLYVQFLEAGFIVLRMALNSKDWDWIEVEHEVLHNVPSLIAEGNIERHKYFWFGERPLYIQRVSALEQEEARSLMSANYKPIWDSMEPLITRLTVPASQQ